MVKVVAFAHKKTGMSDEEFYNHWKQIHGPLATKLVPGMVTYKQNRLLKLPGVSYKDNSLLGIAEVWHDSIESFEELASWGPDNPKAKELFSDEELFMDRSKTIFYRVEEHIIV